jgi:hypothetical protein
MSFGGGFVQAGFSEEKWEGKDGRNPDEECRCEGTEAISRFSMRLPRTLQVLAMTVGKGFSFLNRDLGWSNA